MDDESTRLTEGKWWRFSSYEVRDGWVRPVKGADLEEYDPWAEHDAVAKAQLAADPKLKKVVRYPYQKLMELATLRRVDTPEACTRIASWCQEFGLLGLMSQRTLSVTFSPRWVYNSMDDTVVPGVTEWTRHADGWQKRSGVFWLRNPDGSRVVGKREDIGRPVLTCSEFEVSPTASVLRRSIPSFYRIETASVEAALGDYFPDLSCLDGDGPEHLVPLSEQFWRDSGEKATDIYFAAYAFSSAIGFLARAPFGDNIDAWELENSLETLSVYASGVAQRLVPSSNGLLDLRWTSTSLLASLASMAMQDIAEGRIRVCGARGCQHVFASGSERAVYCSSRCREREMKGRYREKKKVSKRRNRSGEETG